MRMAISPRLAIRTFSNTAASMPIEAGVEIRRAMPVIKTDDPVGARAS